MRLKSDSSGLNFFKILIEKFFLGLNLSTGRPRKKCVSSKSAPNHRVMCSKVISPQKVVKNEENKGNSIVYRNHKVCDGLASLCDGVPSYILLLK